MFSSSLDGVLIALLPAAVCFVLARRPAFFAVPAQLMASRPLIVKQSTWIAPVLMIGTLAALPLMIWLIVHRSTDMQYATFGLTALAALWGAYRLAGRPALAIAGMLVVLSVLEPRLGGNATTSLLAVLAGLGIANVVAVTLRPRPLIIFLAAFAAVDLLLVSSGLTRATLVHLPVAGTFGQMTATAKPFMRIQAGALLLGVGDVVYAALVAAVLVARRAPLRLTMFVSVAYAMGMLVVASCALRSGAMLPATLPGAFALAVMWGVCRWNAAEHGHGRASSTGAAPAAVA